MAAGELSINVAKGTQETSSPRLRLDLGGEFSDLWGEASPSDLSSDGELKIVTVTPPWGGSSKALRFRYGGQTRQHLMGRTSGASGKGLYRSGRGVSYDDGSFIYVAKGNYEVFTRKDDGTPSDVFNVGSRFQIGISGGNPSQYIRVYNVPLGESGGSDISDLLANWQLEFSATNDPTWFPKFPMDSWIILSPPGDYLLRVQVYNSPARLGHPIAVAYARLRVI